MATTRSLSTAPSTAPSDPSGAPAPSRHRLRAVDRDEVVDVADFLPPGATWLPAPPHALHALPGRPPMIGYLVLVPADQRPPFPPVAVPERPDADGTGPLVTGTDPAGSPDPVHSAGPADSPDPASSADEAAVRIDTVQRTAWVDGRELDLTYLEFELLAHLVGNPHRVYTRDQLVTTVWGYGHVGDGRTVDVHIARLRRKLGAEHRRAIQTVRRVGYKYTPPTGG